MREEKLITHTNIILRTLIWRLYRDSADEDYLVARLSYRHGISFTFWWHAQQAVEKYLKASALLNCVNTSTDGHSLSILLSKVKKFSGDLLPMEINPKDYFEQGRGGSVKSESIEAIVRTIEQYGATSSRYRHNPMLARGYWFHQFDELVFLLRRLTFPLDMPCGQLELSFREFLLQDGRWEPHALLPFQSVIIKAIIE